MINHVYSPTVPHIFLANHHSLGSQRLTNALVVDLRGINLVAKFGLHLLGQMLQPRLLAHILLGLRAVTLLAFFALDLDVNIFEINLRVVFVALLTSGLLLDVLALLMGVVLWLFSLVLLRLLLGLARQDSMVVLSIEMQENGKVFATTVLSDSELGGSLLILGVRPLQNDD